MTTEVSEERRLLERVLELAVMLNDDMTRDLAGRGLTESRTAILWELHQRGPSTQKALAAALRVSPRAITGLIDALAEGGFVTREPHPGDRRATLITFTDRGRLAAVALDRDYADLASKLFDDLPETTFRGFTRGVDAVLERLHAGARVRRSG